MTSQKTKIVENLIVDQAHPMHGIPKIRNCVLLTSNAKRKTEWI